MNFKHISVLLNECIEGLNIKKDGIYIDATMGGAGHSFEILKVLSNNGVLIGIDRDIDAINVAKEKLKDFSNVKFICDNHDNITNILKNMQLEKIDGILLDLGVSSYQIDEKTRGFSYINDAKLDMRMDINQKLNAEIVVNEYSREKLEEIIYRYGEERFAKKIADEIVTYRKIKKIETTLELVNIIKKSIPIYYQNKEGHPAKKTFQAIRIEVNNEIEPLYNTIIDCIKVLKNGGRLCVITFHSLEDRAVKLAFTDSIGKCTCSKDLPYCVCNNKSYGKIITKKPILPSLEEMKDNSRSKSAKLRIFEREE